MNFNLMNKSWSESITNTKMLLLANAILASIVLMMIMHQQTIRERIVLVPPHLSEKTELDWDQSGSGYYKEWGTYISGMIGSISPKNIDFVMGAIDRLMDASIAQKVKNGILEQANDPAFKLGQTSAWFEINQVDWEPETKKVFVMGTLNSVTGNTLPISRSAVFEYVFVTKGGLPVVVGFDSYFGKAPHNLKWLGRSRAAAEASAPSAPKTGEK